MKFFQTVMTIDTLHLLMRSLQDLTITLVSLRIVIKILDLKDSIAQVHHLKYPLLLLQLLLYRSHLLDYVPYHHLRTEHLVQQHRDVQIAQQTLWRTIQCRL